MTNGEYRAAPLAFVQTAYKVPDVQQAAQQWAADFGAGPFYLFEHIPLRDVRYLGQATTLDHSSAYGWFGEEMIELVQQNCSQPSVFSERPPGIHHRARFVQSLDDECARLQRLGALTAMTAATSTGMRFAFIDSRAGLGHYTELYEENSGLRAFYDQVRQAAASWDGEEPLRSLAQR
ncbi:MAG: VOC family protein [Pseudomonadota bacterium]